MGNPFYTGVDVGNFPRKIRSVIGETHGIKQSREESNSTSGKNSKAESESVFKRQMRRPETWGRLA